ncbi:MAG: hemerythrin family protein [Rhodospirillales bacterium]|nr:hemerythrin family protein [Rhodospirillales bacterium]
MKIGVEAIDNDHKVLIRLLNQIMNPSIHTAEIDTVVDELLEYTAYHFQREEMIMEVCEYPGLEEHRSLHKNLIEEVSERMQLWRNNNAPEVRSQFCWFLQNWLFQHIMKEDNDISLYIRGKDQAIKEALKNLKSSIDK